MTEDDEPCPKCGHAYSEKVSFSSRHGKTINVKTADYICQVAEKRQGGPTMKPTRADSERYRFVGYIHE